MGEVKMEIERRLRENFQPTHLEVTDDSRKHAGHAGHDPRGESHFTVEIVSARFAGLSRVECQRAVNRALADLLEERVHALAIKASTPES
ncbi:BolA family transcriptional regulator [Sandaracinobacter sp. RS1-74]|uniref:BolA family protein n=1 Tax=Sandaracinobacteroides sayramensis TaxID=2913411 RepID=UPI001EDA5370|nr:BolA family protein [Sandaracinobacteroides sayramensis]MCG2840195.1 BolA family transcriptional regulator [Sandaracinobacteroides sayramensis]